MDEPAGSRQRRWRALPSSDSAAAEVDGELVGAAEGEADDVVEPPDDEGPPSDASTQLTFPCNEFIPCAAAWAGDSQCDEGCNCEEANWDGGDCPIPE